MSFPLSLALPLCVSVGVCTAAPTECGEKPTKGKLYMEYALGYV